MPTKKHSSELQQKIDAKRRRGGRGGRRPAFTAEQKLAIAREYANNEASTCRSLGFKYKRSPSTIWRVLKAIGAVLLLCVTGWGCAAPEPSAPEHQPWEAFEAVELEEGSTLVADALGAALADWSLATGRDLQLKRGAIPVLFVDQAFGRDGEPACASTAIMYRGDSFLSVSWIEVTWPVDRSECSEVEYTLRHEVGHAIARLPMASPHAPRGLMSQVARNGSYEIDADALDYVCAVEACD